MEQFLSLFKFLGNMFRRITATKNLRQRLKIASQISEMVKLINLTMMKCTSVNI